MSLNLKFSVIKAVASEYNYSIKFLCKVWNLNRRSYYKWLKKEMTAREIENNDLKEYISSLYQEFKKIYGYRRITLNLNTRLGTNYNVKRVYRLMREELKISSVIRRKKKKYIKSNAEYKAENVLNREFFSNFPQSKILTDITEFKYGKDKKIYLCVFFDLFDKSVLGYTLSERADTELVLMTLEKSLYGILPKSILIHSDRGCQYTSLKFKEKLEELGIKHSMSRVGKCIDNGPMEGFFGNIKSEMYYLKKYLTLEELEKDIHSYMKFYNEERLQKNLGNLSPIQYRNRYNGIENNVDN